MKTLRYWLWALTVILSSTAFPAAVSADTVSHVVISELQTGSSASASQEFIELYNPTAHSVALSGWTFEYKSAAASDAAENWTKRASLAGNIGAAGFYLVAPKAYLANADADWSATLAGTGGAIRLKDGSGNVVDQLAYGATAIGAEGSAAAAPSAGQSIERLPGRLDELAGNGVDTGNNSNDFIIRPQPAPQFTASPPELADTQPSDDDVSIPQPTDDPGSTVTPSSYAQLFITELLPNPMTPQLDSEDEYVELYNPTSDAVNLKGYTLRTGSNFHDYYVLSDEQLAAGAYLVLYARQTGLAMPNSGGAVELLDPSGAVSDQTPPYGAAPDGQAWAYFDSGWTWTLQLTPGQTNVFAALPLTPGAVKTAKPKTAAAAKKPAVAKKAKAATKPAAKKRKAAKPKTVSALPHLVAERNLQPANWLIISLAALTIGYAIYEFRYDILNLYDRLRGHTPPGPEHRPSATGRGDD